MEGTSENSFFQAFPNYDPAHLSVLDPAPDGSLVYGTCYSDLFNPPTFDGFISSPTYISFLSNLRNLLSHVLLIQASGFVENAIEYGIMWSQIGNFYKSYCELSAIRIQRFWRYKHAPISEKKTALKLYHETDMYHLTKAKDCEDEQVRIDAINTILGMMKQNGN